MANVVLRVKDEQDNVYDLDINANEPILFEVSTIEIGDIGKVFGVASNKFSLPGTKSNNRFFGHLFNLGAVPNLGLVHSVRAQIIVDGDAVFTGRLFLEEIITDQQGYTTYDVTLTDELIDFKSQVQDLSICDLDWSPLYHNYSYANISSSWGGNLLSGSIYYPLVDYGVDASAPNPLHFPAVSTDETSYNIRQFKPSIRIKDYVDRLFAVTSYSYTSSWLNSAEVQNYFILACNEAYTGLSGESSLLGVVGGSNQNELLVYAATPSTSRTVGDIQFEDYGYNGANTIDLEYDTIFYGAQPIWDDAIDRIVITNPSVVDFEVKATVKITAVQEYTLPPPTFYFATALFEARIILVDDDTDAVVWSSPIATVPQPIPVDIDFPFVYAASVSLPAGTYKFRFYSSAVPPTNIPFDYYIQNQTVPPPASVSFFVRAGSDNTWLKIKGVSQNSPQVDMGAQLGGCDVKAYDYLQGLIEKFNLIIEPLQSDPTVMLIEPYNDWIAMGEVDNWDDYVDESKRITIKHPIIDLPKTIRFSDLDDEDDFNVKTRDIYELTYGERELIADSDIATGDTSIGKMFAATPVGWTPGNEKIVVPHLTKRDSGGIDRPIKFKPRLLQKVTGSMFGSSVRILAPEGYYSLSGTYYTLLPVNAPDVNYDTGFDLHFNNNGFYHYQQPQNNGLCIDDAFFRYWAFYINSLYDYDARKLTCNAVFDPFDVKLLRRNNRYWYKGHYWRIDSIKGVSITEPSNVEVNLIKLLELNFKYPRQYITADQILTVGEVGPDGLADIINLGDPKPDDPCYKLAPAKFFGNTSMNIAQQANGMLKILATNAARGAYIGVRIQDILGVYPLPGTTMDVTVTLNSTIPGGGNFNMNFGYLNVPAQYVAFSGNTTSPQTQTITWGPGNYGNNPQFIFLRLPVPQPTTWTGVITIDFDNFGICP
jgi:hypothetical protein